MAIEINVNGIKKDLSNLIVSILVERYPLRIGEVQNNLKEKFNVKISFQAVRKALNKMVNHGKLDFNRNGYSINKEWIKENKKLSDDLIRSYFRGEQKEKPPKVNKIGKEHHYFEFENSLQTDKFFGELLLDIAETYGKKKLCIQAPHYWYFLGHFGTESNFLQEMIKKETDFYYISHGKEFLLDKMAKKYYEQHGVKFKIVKGEFDKNVEVGVINDFVMRISYPEEFIKKLEKIFSKTKTMENFDYLGFGNLIKSNYKITIDFFKDKTLAESFRKSVLKYF